MAKLPVSYAVVGIFIVLGLGFLMIQTNSTSNYSNSVARPSQNNFVYFGFGTNPLTGALANATVLKIDGITYKYGQTPASLQFSQGSFNIYAFSQTIATNSSKVYVLNTINSTCGLTARQGTFYATNSCVITATYK